MSCIICGGTPANEPFRKDYIVIEDGTKHGSRSKDLHDFCPDCHQRGEYVGLASAVIAEAIADYCHPKLNNKTKLEETKRNQMDAMGFIFGNNIIMWAQIAQVDVEDIRNYVRKIVQGGNYVH